MIYRIDETTSTNDEARDAKYRHGDIVWAERQTAGRGQRGHTWTSPEGENLTFSMVLEPRFLPVGEQFLLSEAVTLALTDTFAAYGIDTRIKWTNDIYVGDRKLVGILIEHNHAGASLSRTIAGIGINVNQTEFDPALPNPVSMAMVAGRTFDRGEVLEAFRRQIDLSLEYGLPIAVHTRDAWPETVELMREYKGRGVRGVFHAFSDTADTYRELKEYGDFVFGIGGGGTFKKSKLADAVREMELRDIVLETDCPYLTPAPHRGERNESAYVRYVCEKVAELKGLTPGETAEATTANAERIFGK